MLPGEGQREREKHSESLLNEAELKTPFIFAAGLPTFTLLYSLKTERKNLAYIQ